jgi:chromosome segregation ATPase
VQSLTTAITELERQLERVVASNDALRADLEEERSRRLLVEGKLEELRGELVHKEQEVGDREALLSEIAHLHAERGRLAGSERELSEQLAAARQERDGLARKVERLVVSRQEALEEVQTVEAQFERAMRVADQTRAQAIAACEDRDALRAELHALEKRNASLVSERDALISEVELSRRALDEIRSSLLAACGQAVTGAVGREPADADTTAETEVEE